jgi:hypothetical protein
MLPYSVALASGKWWVRFFPVFHPVGLIRLGPPISKMNRTAHSEGSEIPEKIAASMRFHYLSGITAPPFLIRADRAGSALPAWNKSRLKW